MQAGDIARDGLIPAPDLFHRLWLQVERVMMGKAAAEEDQDDRLGPGRLSGTGRGLRHACARLLRRQQPAQRESQWRERADPDEIPPRPAIAEAMGFGG